MYSVMDPGFLVAPRMPFTACLHRPSVMGMPTPRGQPLIRAAARFLALARFSMITILTR